MRSLYERLPSCTKRYMRAIGLAKRPVGPAAEPFLSSAVDRHRDEGDRGNHAEPEQGADDEAEKGERQEDAEDCEKYLHTCLNVWRADLFRRRTTYRARRQTRAMSSIREATSIAASR